MFCKTALLFFSDRTPATPASNNDQLRVAEHFDADENPGPISRTNVECAGAAVMGLNIIFLLPFGEIQLNIITVSLWPNSPHTAC